MLCCTGQDNIFSGLVLHLTCVNVQQKAHKLVFHRQTNTVKQTPVIVLQAKAFLAASN